MPAWVVRLGLALAQALLGDESLKKLMGLVLGLLLLLLALVLSLPALVMHIPLVTVDKIGNFAEVVQQVSDGTKTADDPEGITIPWEEVTAVWAVQHEQDFSGATDPAIRRLARQWAERHQREEVHTAGEFVWTETHVWYTLRDLEQVMDLLGFNAEQKEQTQLYLRALQEEGLKTLSGGTG